MDPALWEFLRRSTDRDSREVEAIVRLDRPQARVAGLRIVSRFGCIATCRLRKDSILDVHRNDHVVSLKAARALGPEHRQQAGDPAPERSRPDGDSRRPPGLRLTGAGVTVGFVDWGCDFDHPNFKRRDGSTRFRALWDQRGPVARRFPQPYGYGTVHDRSQINRALRTADPYATLGYHPGDADRDGSGTHGTHVMDIAAGNGLAGGPSGVAPEADLVFVHLADRGTSGLANLGDSVRILEAVDFIARTAGPRPWVINISVGRHGGPHDGCTLVELALDSLLKAAPGRFIVQSVGNYFGSRTHASGLLEAGQVRSLTVMTLEADVTPNELEIWYSGEDELAVQVASPTGQQTGWIPLSGRADVIEDDRIVGRIYHRHCDPNNHDNHIELFLDPWAPAGPWRVSLRAVRIRHGVFHAWLERDEACADCQARFVEADADGACTTGTIANAHLPLVVGAYDSHSPTQAVAEFSSAGPTRDGRFKPDLVAPGVRILAARSAPPGSVSSLGLLTVKSGTSMAAPHVTGTVALCLQGAPRPPAAGEIRELLLRNAGPMAGAASSSRYGCGYLNVVNVVTAVSALGRRLTPRPDRSAEGRPWHNPKETNMDPELNEVIPAYLSPDRLFRELLYRQGGPVSAWIGDAFTVVALPGESPVTQPEAGDVLVRVALGEPGLGHVAVLSDSGLRPRGSLDQTYVQAEHGGPGLYAIVNEHSTYPRARSDRVARRVLDHTGHMPPGQVLLRPKPPHLPDLDLPGTVIRETAKDDAASNSEGEAGTHDTGGLPDETSGGGEMDGSDALADDLEGASSTLDELEDSRRQGTSETTGEGSALSDTDSGVDSTLENDQFIVDPSYHSDEDGDVPAVWELADRVRSLLQQKTHDKRDRGDLERAVARQLRTVVLYQTVSRIVKAATSPGLLTMYVLLFPGEARDNTGLKDLNDNVLGYTLNQQFTARRQKEIERTFHPQFVVVGQDFKTALFVTWEQNRAEFDKRLHELDKALRQILLNEFLPKSDKKGARELRRVLEKDPDYRFDVYYGTDGLDVSTSARDVLLTIFLLLTQALKGAATARYAAKGRRLKVPVVKPFGMNAAADNKFDLRGRGFAQPEFLRVAGIAPAIKAFVLKPARDQASMLEYNDIYVDTVWTQAFLKHQNVGNRDVIRDVRKKKLVKPPLPNVKHTFAAQKELLELWIVVLNLIDFTKDFLEEEFAHILVLNQHDNAVLVLENLRDPAKPVDRRQVEDFLTRDLRQEKLAVLGTASEFQFYATAADWSARIVFIMDVRDLGVEVLKMYDVSNARILDSRLADRRLLQETIRSTDVVTEMRRFTYDMVVQTFGRYHALLKHSGGLRRTDGSEEAALAFKKAFDPLGEVDNDVQVMLGGDEVMIAAHPRFAAYLHNIVADLSTTVLGPGPIDPLGRAGGQKLGIRVGVAFSLAKTAAERREHQLAHHKAMRLADESHGLLKDMERRKRRIERLLDMLERNPDKEKDAPKYHKRLDELRLGKLFTRVQHGKPTVLPMERIEPLVRALREGKLPTRDGSLVELVDFDGNVVDHGRLTKDADALEEAVRKKVGRDNLHIDPPPARKLSFGGVPLEYSIKWLTCAVASRLAAVMVG
jgi:subtilisin family serine protease